MPSSLLHGVESEHAIIEMVAVGVRAVSSLWRPTVTAQVACLAAGFEVQRAPQPHRACRAASTSTELASDAAKNSQTSALPRCDSEESSRIGADKTCLSLNPEGFLVGCAALLFDLDEPRQAWPEVTSVPSMVL